MNEHCPNAFTYISDIIDIARSASTPKNESDKGKGKKLLLKAI